MVYRAKGSDTVCLADGRYYVPCLEKAWNITGFKVPCGDRIDDQMANPFGAESAYTTPKRAACGVYTDGRLCLDV